jgi:hypothetical protein
VADRPPLELAAAQGGERSLGDHVRAEEVGHAADLRPRRSVAGPVLIREHGQGDLLPAAEVGGVARRRLPDQHQVRAGGLELLTGVVQLDRVCLAVDSAVVAQPHQGGGALAPEIAEAHGVPTLVPEHDLSKLVRVLKLSPLFPLRHGLTSLLTAEARIDQGPPGTPHLAPGVAVLAARIAAS